MCRFDNQEFRLSPTCLGEMVCLPSPVSLSRSGLRYVRVTRVDFKSSMSVFMKSLTTYGDELKRSYDSNKVKRKQLRRLEE